jgi:hypothetical protein
MAFVQIMDLRSSKFDEIQALDREWERATEGKRTLRRSIVARDRSNPEHYVVLAFFDSYESAMENSNLPETGDFATRIAKLVDGAMGFTDFDIVEDRS